MADYDEIVKAVATAIVLGDIDTTRRLLTEHATLVRGTHGPDPWISTAVSRENVAMVTLLIDLGCDVNAEEIYSTRLTALSIAVMKDNVTITQLLLEHGANPNQGRQIIGAIAGNHRHSLELVKLFERHGADFHRVFVNEMTNEPMNALSTAIDWDQEEVADYLRSIGAVMPDSTPTIAPEPSLADEIVAYFKDNFGPVKPQALIEIVPSEPPIEVHVIPASKDRNHITLFTTGMSAQAMAVPEGGEDFQYAELFVQLPAKWPYTKIDDPKHGWPIHWLRSTAKYPHQNESWLGGAVTILANDDPPQPLAPNVKFTSLLFLAEKSFVSRDGRNIRLYRMAPLYTEERDLEIREGIDALLRAFDSHNIPFIVDTKRPSVA